LHFQNRLEGERINMWLDNVQFVLVTVIIVVYSHDCKDYDLSASDQSLVDMMKHYLYTSRKEECPPQSKILNAGVTYIRWGKTNCPKGVDIVYTGQVGGNQHSYRGGGVNYLCLPNDPQNGQHQSYDNDQVHGGEYRLDAKTKPSGWSESMGDKEIPCAVCYQKRRSAVIMIPALFFILKTKLFIPSDLYMRSMGPNEVKVNRQGQQASSKLHGCTKSYTSSFWCLPDCPLFLKLQIKR
ncbi:hypothetical protein AM593_02678, partial [Mytilus galloprovincialis]